MGVIRKILVEFCGSCRKLAADMDLTTRRTYLDLRDRYLRLLTALRRTRQHNPETLEALERAIPPESLGEPVQNPVAQARSDSEAGNRVKHAA